MSIFSNKKNLPLDAITPKVISLWQSQYPDGVFTISIDGKLGYFRMLKKSKLDKFLIQFTKKELPKQKEGKEASATLFALMLVKYSWLGGDFELLTNEAYKNELLQKGGNKILGKINIEFPGVLNMVNTYNK
jgi:hypothetical protein